MAPRPLNVLMWHVHGSWTTSMVHGNHRYLLPKLPESGPNGLGRAGRPWPESAVETAPEALRYEPIDVVILQRPDEIALVAEWTGRVPGVDIPALYVEHNTPMGPAVATLHPLADQSAIPIVHVTHFNQLMWDNGRCPTEVITHGIPDPGYSYDGTLDRAVAMINEPVRRSRRTGFDLLMTLSDAAPIDVFGIGTAHLDLNGRVIGCDDVAPPRLYHEVARRRVYVHTARWTSLGLSLIEAMYVGMPVVAVAATAAPSAVPTDGGVVSADPEILARGVREFVSDPDRAREAGLAARRWAQREFGLESFLAKWDRLLSRVTS